MHSAADGELSTESQPQSVRSKSVGRLFAALTALVVVFAAGRFAYALAVLGHSAWEPWTRVALFAAAAFAVTIGPGVYLWSVMDVKTDNPFLPSVFIVATSLGFTIFASWMLYLFGGFAKFALALLIVEAGLGLSGLPKVFSRARRSVARITVSPCEFAAFALTLLFCEGLFECVAGTPLTAWDAVVSWDKWASDIAVRRGLGGYVSGAYPPGIPLLVGLLYKQQFLVSAVECSTSVEHLLATGFFQVFPLLLALSLLAISRRFKTNAFWSVAVFFGCGSAVHQIVKYIGYVDVPLAALTVAAAAVVFCLGENDGGARFTCSVVFTDGNGQEKETAGGVGESRGPRFAALFLALFPVAFVKGNGFVALVIVAVVLTISSLRRKSDNQTICKPDNLKILLAAVWSAIAFAAVFYLHQWVVGVWTDWGETNPFNHSLAVMSSHGDLVKPTFAHLCEVFKRLCAVYGFERGPMAVAFTVFAVACFAAPLALRKTRIPAALALALAAIWFFTGSYDERNILLAIAVEAVVLPLYFAEICRNRSCARIASLCVILPLCAYSVWATGLSRIVSACFHRYAAPASIVASPEMRARRLMKLVPGGYEYFTVSPAVGRAGRVMTFSEAYRHLDGKGVYPLQNNALNGLAPHDLAVESRGGDKALFKPKPPFVPISELNGCKSLGVRLYVYEPVMVEPRSEIGEEGGSRTISIPVEGDVPACGFLAVTFDGPANGVDISLHSPDSLSGSIFSSFSDGNVSRLAYWVDENASQLTFKLDAPSDLKIIKTEVGY